MATRFEIVLHGDDATHLRAAAEEALDEIARLEAQLSLFRPTSEIAQVNARAAYEPVRVSPETFRLLEHAAKLSAETGGAFDITIAPLMRAWGFVNGDGHLPAPAQLAAARECVGMKLVQLDPTTNSVRFTRPGVMLDLGAIGKGYAVERAAELLREAGITSALIHGGTSTTYAIGCPLDAAAWKIAVGFPQPGSAGIHAGEDCEIGDLAGKDAGTPRTLLTTIPLRDESLSMSAWWGKSFRANGRDYGHVIDPRTGEPADNASLAVVVTNSATDSDALSTALLTLGPDAVEQISSLRPGLRALAVAKSNGPQNFKIQSRGLPVSGFNQA